MLVRAVDLIHQLLDIAPIIMLLCVASGAFVLWRRTKRVVSLVQFIASLLLFAATALQALRWRFVTPYDHSVYADVMRSEPMRMGMDFAFHVGVAAFAISYAWFALTHKRI